MGNRKRLLKSAAALLLSTALVLSAVPVYLTDVQEVYAADNQGQIDVRPLQPENGFLIEDGVLKKYSGTAKDVVIPDGVTSIGYLAFGYCSGLRSVVIPEGVTSIGNDAFSGCSGLTGIEIPGSVTSIGNSAFFGCSGLRSVVISEGVTSIGGGAFGYSGLTSVEIPGSVTSIGNGAFNGCRKPDEHCSRCIKHGI